MEQEGNNIQLRRVILIIKLVKLKMSSSPFLLTTGYICPERIHYEKNVNHSFKILLWKKLTRKQLEGETSSSFSNKWS